VNISVAFGAGLAGIAVIIIGLIGRTIGVMISLAGSHLNIKERFFCAIAYIPKATVQAAIGGIPLASGVVSGELILAIAVLAIIITAPLGAIGISTFAPRLLEDDSNGVEEVA
jgi:solute carrier family 9B (sodium/hydrogen exchanger), member 1/2